MPRKSEISLLVFSTLFALLLGELLLRWLSPVEEFNHHKLYCEYDPVLGWRKIPNFTGEHHTSEYLVTEHINSQGIRGPEHSFEKKPGEYRILVLGDSFAEGYTVNFKELFSEVLKDSLLRKCPGSQFEVINAGTGGYSTDQELLYFEKEGLRYQSDFVILLFCSNDPWYNAQPSYWRGFKPQFLLEGDSLRLTNVPVPLAASKPLVKKIKDWLLQNSQVIRRVKNLKDALIYASNRQIVPDEWKVYKLDPSPETDQAWQVTAALLHRLNLQATAAGSKLLVFYIPEKIEVYPASWADFIQTYSLDEKRFSPDLPRRQLSSICDSLCISFLDPSPTFADLTRTNPSARFYFEKDWHWNAAGNKIVGTLLSNWFDCQTAE